MKKEIERLRRVYHEQNMQKAEEVEEEVNGATIGENDGGSAAETGVVRRPEGGGRIC